MMMNRLLNLITKYLKNQVKMCFFFGLVRLGRFRTLLLASKGFLNLLFITFSKISENLNLNHKSKN